MTNVRKYKFMSFFSGAMGMDIGLEKAGWDCIFASDNDKYCIETIRSNVQKLSNPNVDIFHDDIRNFNTLEYLSDKSISKSEIFAIVGGPPCQAFSSAGKRKGLSDERGNVLVKYFDIVDDIKPKYVVIENVRGMLSMPISENPFMRYPIEIERDLLESKNGLMLLFIEQFKKMGYEVSFTLYDTSRFGVPQKRERVIMIAHKGHLKVPLLQPTHFIDKEPHFLTLFDAIGDLQGKKLVYPNFPEKRIKYYKLLKEGENWRNLPEYLQKEALGNSYPLGGGKTGFLRRLAWDKPSPTLINHPSNFPATDLCHPDVIRPLSIEEYARIQQFPDDWEFAGNITHIYKQIGNAVPIGFGEIIGKHIINFEENQKNARKQDNEIGNYYSRYKNTSHLYFESLLKKPVQLDFIN